jgi:hypothetical protein
MVFFPSVVFQDSLSRESETGTKAFMKNIEGKAYLLRTAVLKVILLHSASGDLSFLRRAVTLWRANDTGSVIAYCCAIEIRVVLTNTGLQDGSRIY